VAAGYCIEIKHGTDKIETFANVHTYYAGIKVPTKVMKSYIF
jgi:hypothetical protein